MDPRSPASDAERDQRGSGVRLAELVAAFSLASDLGLGQPMEHVLRSWLIAARLSERTGLEPEARHTLYYVVTLAMVGCVAETPELASWFGDDIALRRDKYEIDFVGLPKQAFALRHVALGSPSLERVRQGARLMAFGSSAVQQILISHCITTGRMADRLGLGDEVIDPLQQVFARWDGKGVPSGLGGEDLATSARLFHLADVVEVAHRSHGIDGALQLARSRRGTQLDPSLVDVFCAAAAELVDDLDAVADWDALIADEPGLQKNLSGAELDDALEAVADFTDLRSPSRAGHSRAVAELSARAAELCGLPEEDVTNVRRAGFVHDLGMHGVPATILDKIGPLSGPEAERMRMHAYYTERMLVRPPALAKIGTIGSLANERLDGSGYHRGFSGPQIPAAGRILAAADAFQAMREPRPHRPPLSAKDATATIRAEVRAGRFGVDAVDAVLEAAGQRKGKRQSGPAGLTPREVEVLVLIARGASNKQVARRLNIAPKTAGTHIERIYTKIGASSRSTATLFALQEGLLDSLEPLDL
jgi:HD-GYP domain-containing protein (c-di-GMP phosphodiesterase class II)